MDTTSILAMLHELCERIIGDGSHIGIALIIIGIAALGLGVSTMFISSETFKQSDNVWLDWFFSIFVIASTGIIVLLTTYVTLCVILLWDEN